jgi:hypothetical protein
VRRLCGPAQTAQIVGGCRPSDDAVGAGGQRGLLMIEL